MARQARYGKGGRGKARQARLDTSRRVMEWLGRRGGAMRGKAWRGLARQATHRATSSKAEQGTHNSLVLGSNPRWPIWRGVVRQARRVTAGQGTAGSVWQGEARKGVAGPAGRGGARHGLGRHGMVRRGLESQGRQGGAGFDAKRHKTARQAR